MENPTSGNGKAMPYARASVASVGSAARRAKNPACLLSADEVDEIRDHLTLALDALTGPLDSTGLRHLINYQRAALKVTHLRAEAM